MRCARLWSVGLAALLALLTPWPVLAQKPVAERPTYQLGEKWIRSDGAFEMVRIEDGDYVFVAEDGSEIHVNADLMISVIRRKDGRQWWMTPPLRLPWPLEVGKSGRSSGGWGGPDGAGAAEFEWEVEKYEDVRVPAGTFKAFRIRVQITREIVYRPPSGERSAYRPPERRTLVWTLRTWYAPEVRQHVKASGRNVGPFAYEVVAIEKPAVVPLGIALREPADQARVEEDEILIAGRAAAGPGVRRLAVTVNNVSVFAKDEPQAPQQLPFDVPVRLRDGKNVIIVTATDRAGDTRQEARVVFFDNPVQAGPPGTPLRVRLPESSTRVLPVAGEPIVLTTSARDPAGIVEVKAFLNDVEVARQPGGNRTEVPLEMPMTLREGENVLLIIAVEPRGGATQMSRVLMAERRPPTAIAAAPSVPKPPEKVPEPKVATPPPLPTKPAQPPAAPPQPARPETSPAITAPPPAPLPAKPAEPPATPAEPPAVTISPQPGPTPSAPPTTLKVVAATPPAPPLPPLRVTLTSPANQATVQQEAIGLAGLVAGGKGVTRVVVTLNGVELSRREERTPLRAMAVNLPVKLREGQNTLVVTATDVDGVIDQEVRAVHYDKVVPLGLDVRYPPDQAKVADEASVLAAMVTSSKGVATVRVTLNGVEVSRQSERAPPKSLVVTAPLKLREGANVVAISAEEPDGTVRQELRTVFFDRPKVAAVPPPPPPAAPRHERWAVVIGVGQYEHPSIPRLRYAVADAEAIHRTLVGSAGFKKENVLLLTDATERKPTLRNIKWALGTFLARSARKDDTVLMFFAGHGAPEVDPRGQERDGLAKYLIPGDADPDDLFSTALPMDDLHTIFGRIEAERVVAFIDACYSGAAGGRTFQARKTRAISVDEAFLDRLTRVKGRAIVTASRPAEVSIELDDLRHGIFTYYLVQGLQGAADTNRDGEVTLQELYGYLEREVARKARAVGGNQHPVMKGELEGTLPLILVPTR